MKFGLRVGPILRARVLISIETQIYRGKTAKKRQKQSHDTTSQRMPKISRKYQKLEQSKSNSSLQPLEGVWPC